MNKRRILIIETDTGSRSRLARALETHGYDVQASADGGRAKTKKFDLIISDVNTNGIRAFRLDATNFLRCDEDKIDLRAVIEQTLNEKLRLMRNGKWARIEGIERIEFELPSDVALMHAVLNFVMARVAAHGIIESEDDAHLFIALDEAFVNAVKHGNKHDATKFVRFTIDINEQEARFTIEDEGAGFDLRDVPDPRAPENLFKASGRGVLLIQNIMDEVEYNAHGNHLTMVKRKSQDAATQNHKSRIPISESQIEQQLARDEEPSAERN